MIWLLQHFLHSQYAQLATKGRLRKRDNLLTGKGGGGAGAKLYDGEMARSSINHSILSESNPFTEGHTYSSERRTPHPPCEVKTGSDNGPIFDKDPGCTRS
jgi:hypothetical protein